MISLLKCSWKQVYFQTAFIWYQTMNHYKTKKIKIKKRHSVRIVLRVDFFFLIYLWEKVNFTSSSFITLIKSPEILYLLIFLTYFSPPFNPIPSGNHMFVLCDSLSVFFYVDVFCFLESTYKWEIIIHYLSFSVWISSLRILYFRSSVLLQWLSWSWISVSFPRVGMFSAITSSNKFSILFFLSPSGTLKIWSLLHLMLSKRSLKLSSFFKTLFFSI